MGSLIAFYEKVKRMIFWGWKMRNSWDFDACTIYDMLQLKLERLLYVFKNHGHCEWNSDENNSRMKQLREAIELLKRKGAVDELNYVDDVRKIAEREGWIIGYKDKHRFNCIFKDPASEKKYRKLFKREFERHNKLYKLRHERLFELLKKNVDGWWD